MQDTDEDTWQLASALLAKNPKLLEKSDLFLNSEGHKRNLNKVRMKKKAVCVCSHGS